MKPEACDTWDGLTLTSNLNRPVPPLFDYRWNGMWFVNHKGPFHRNQTVLILNTCELSSAHNLT
jgi:hypothetical protein